MELITSSNNLSLEAERKIIEFKEAMKLLRDKEEEFNKLLMDEMDKRGIISYKDENMSISLIASGEQERFDTTAFKKKFPDIYKKYVKTNEKKGYVRVSITKGISSKNMNEKINPKVEMIQVKTNGKIESF